ncbi:MAG: hypothetical protein AMXMBFR53_25470 [Gemmatimonadota bacterium]
MRAGRLWTAVAAGLGWLPVLPASSAAQGTTTLTGPAGCTTCAVTLERVATLGTTDGPASFSGGPRVVVRDSRGYLYVVDYQEPATVFVFDARGAFVRRMGRHGQGPGELRHVTVLVVGPGDSLHVLDRGNQRRSVYGPDGGWARSDPWRVLAERGLAVGADAVALNGHDPANPLSPRLVQVYGLDGTRRASLGTDTATSVRDPMSLLYPENRSRVMGRAAGGVWVGRPDAYRIEEWTQGGQLLRAVERRAEFFPEGLAFALATPEQPPNPRLVAIHSPDPGTVWTVAHVAARDWRSGVGARIERPDGYVGYELDGDALYDSVLELWDLAGRRVLVSHRVPAQLQGFLSNDLLWAWRQDALGIPYVDVWRLTLRGGP